MDSTPKDLETEMTALSYRLVTAHHQSRHTSGINATEFNDCRRGMCGEWHDLQKRAKHECSRCRGTGVGAYAYAGSHTGGFESCETCNGTGRIE
jgi:DnaJ-class molecular chaperone